MVVICAGCERPILDRFLLNVLERAWHAKCVQCADCNDPLTEKCFSRDGKLFCRDDFFRRFGTKCGGCSQGISPNDLVRRARNKVFHLKCFTCMVCRKQLSTGEELYVLDENKFICKEDYLNSKYTGSDHEDDMDIDQSMLDKLEQESDKCSLPGDVEEELSRDSSLPPLTATTPGAPSGPISGTGTNSTGGPTPPPPGAQGANSNISANSSNSSSALNSSIEVKQEKNNNMETADANGGHTSDSNSTSGKEDNNKENNSKSDSVEENGKTASGTKRRGPRTTIKAKQLETLKAAFNATPKPTRHIREQLAQETGLNMRVIQVWFQNRRSKERRMKQLSALGARRQFFRNPRRLRALRPGEELGDAEMMGQPGFNYFGENGEFYPGYPGYNDYFPGQPGDPANMPFLPPNSGPQGSSPMVDGPMPGQMGPEGQFMHPDMGLPPTSSPEPHIPSMHPDGPFGNAGMPPRSMGTGFNQQLTHGPPEMAQETW